MSDATVATGTLVPGVSATGDRLTSRTRAWSDGGETSIRRGPGRRAAGGAPGAPRGRATTLLWRKGGPRPAEVPACIHLAERDGPAVAAIFPGTAA